MPAVGVGPVLAVEPARVAGHVREAFVRDGFQRLPQQLPAFLDLVGRHVVQAHELRMVDVVLLVSGLDRLEHRIFRPRFARRAGLRHFGQPHLETLVCRVFGQQPVQRRGPGARQAGDEDGPLDGHVGILRILLPRSLAQQPRDQRAAQESAVDFVAVRGQIGFMRHRNRAAPGDLRGIRRRRNRRGR